MRAQAAIVEAFLAIAVLGTSASAFAAWTYTHTGALASLGVNQTDAAYDFSELALGGRVRQCIAAWDRQCLRNVSSNMVSLYRLGYFAVRLGGNEVSAGWAGDCARRLDFCVPFDANGTAEALCTSSCA